MRSSSVLVALVTLSGVESRIEDQLERQHVIAPDTPTEVHEYYAPGIGGSPDVTQQQASSDSKANTRWFPFGGEASNYYDDSGESKAPVENLEKVPEAAASRPTAFLQQPSQEVHEYYAPTLFGGGNIPVQVPDTKSSGSETWFPFSAASASVKGDDAGLPEQGFHGEDVEHKDGETQTGDWGGEYQHPPEQSKKESEATTHPPSAFLQEPTQEVHEYYAPWFGAPDVSQVQQASDAKESGNERWFPFAAASAPVFNEDQQ